MKRSLAFLLITASLLTSLTGCLFRTKDQVENTAEAPITLVFYGLYDGEEAYTESINDFESLYPNVNIIYKRFLNPQEYWDLIINELAEGEGPDVFLMNNSQLPSNYKKVTPAPLELVNPETFKELFVEVAGEEWVFPDQTGVEKVWGMPLYVDSLALYYNKAHFEDAIPTQGKPSETWEGIKRDVTLLNREDQSFERFERAGIAMGRGDNILRSFDILVQLLLQAKVAFYDEDLKRVVVYQDPDASKVFDLFTSFGLQNQKNYSWNKFLANPSSPEKELTTFALGKVSMMMGYSFTYGNLVQEINRLRQLGEETIDVADIKIQETPQFFDPSVSKETREAYANYYVPVVSRTSANKEIAWRFLNSMATEEHLKTYFQKTHKPSALRSLIPSQQADPIYGVFASQVGYAASFPMANPGLYKEAFLKAVEEILGGTLTNEALSNMAESINRLIPTDGLLP